ncbi:hypothetical protein [Nocardia abscessus]|uniref:hypothetical protein n=1 Tax=Nocardia abscessus TaxID=120957 RepID=UPI0024570A0A|nr:hypothetical protein [Nocardia abscessus]
MSARAARTSSGREGQRYNANGTSMTDAGSTDGRRRVCPTGDNSARPVGAQLNGGASPAWKSEKPAP